MESLSQMLQGFPDLNDYIQGQRLGTRQRASLVGHVLAVAAYRRWLAATGGAARAERKLREEQKKRVGLELHARPWDRPRPEGQHYLSDGEIGQFERDGLLGPFRVMPREDAKALAADLQRSEEDFTRNCYLGQPVVQALKRHDGFKFDYSAVYQALRHQGLWDLTTSAPIAQRTASLLGEDVICWRSQLFEKRPGATGTFWHQNSVFREGSVAKKLYPTTPVDPGMIQLTAWVALTDSTVENGALRMVPGTFVDGRLEHAYEYAYDNKLDFLASLPADRLEGFLRIGLFSSGPFAKAQALFQETASRYKDMLAGRQVRDLPMQAGEAIIFTSLNMHASFANQTKDDTRLAFAGRYANGDVRVHPNRTHDTFPTTEGDIPYPVAPLACIQVHGEDRLRHNHVVTRCGDPSARPMP